MRPRGPSFVSRRITDIDRSLKFYDAIGLFELDRIQVRDGRTVLFLDTVRHERSGAGDYSLELNYTAGESGYEMGTAYRHIGITTPDIDATLARLAEQRVEPEWSPNVPKDSPLRICFVRDPDGHEVELIGRS